MTRKQTPRNSRTYSWLETLPVVNSDFTDPSKASTPPPQRRQSLLQSGTRTTLGVISPNRMSQSPSKNPDVPKTPGRARSQIVGSNDDPERTPTANLATRSLPLRPQPQRQESPTRPITRSQKSRILEQEEVETWREAQEDDDQFLDSASQKQRRSKNLRSQGDEDDEEDDEEEVEGSESVATGITSSNVELEGVTIIQTTFDDKKYPLPDDAKSFASSLRSILQKSKIIPFCFRGVAEAEFSDFDSPTCIAAKESDCLLRLSTDEASRNDLWKEVLKIKDRALECAQGKYSEPAWNCEVHSSLLRCALEGYYKDQKIWYRNVTTHRITEKIIQPKIQGKRKPGQMVDFSIVMTPPKNLVQAVRNKMGKSFNLNQTSADDVENALIGANLETKVKALDISKGIRQLACWNLAQYNKMRQLNPGLTWQELPFLPAILTQEHAWNLYIIRMISQDEILVQGPMLVGTSAGLVGIFQILCTIQRLALWTRDHGNWWRQYVLGF
ncbi:hypothetical protein ACLMJK_003826 [Lecanora helva]